MMAFASSANAQLNQGAGLGAELVLDFKSIIGNPLIAVIDAQSQAGKSTVDFIEGVGFEKDEDSDARKVAMVSFNYEQDVNGSIQKKSMSVPFLFIVPIPFIQVDLITIDLSVKLNSVETESSSVETTSKSSMSAKSRSFWGTNKSSMKASVTTQKKTASSATVTRDFQLVIHVSASQAPMPEGARRMMDLFDAIVRTGATPVSA
jgi:hypothetical protein